MLLTFIKVQDWYNNMLKKAIRDIKLAQLTFSAI